MCSLLWDRGVVASRDDVKQKRAGSSRSGVQDVSKSNLNSLRILDDQHNFYIPVQMVKVENTLLNVSVLARWYQIVLPYKTRCILERRLKCPRKNFFFRCNTEVWNDLWLKLFSLLPFRVASKVTKPNNVSFVRNISLISVLQKRVMMRILICVSFTSGSDY